MSPMSQPTGSSRPLHVQLGPKWAVIGSVGKGAFSEIFAAAARKRQSWDQYHEVSGDEEIVAVKLQNADFDSSVMKWEGHVMKEMTDATNVTPKFISYGHEDDRDFLVMELLTGEDMAAMRDRIRGPVNNISTGAVTTTPGALTATTTGLSNPFATTMNASVAVGTTDPGSAVLPATTSTSCATLGGPGGIQGISGASSMTSLASGSKLQSVSTASTPAAMTHEQQQQTPIPTSPVPVTASSGNSGTSGSSCGSIPRTRRVPIPLASYLTRQMVKCLKPLHERGFIHRDVKPSNFVRRSTHSTEFVMIDFGLAKQHRDDTGKLRPQRKSAEFRGTTIYASPYAHLKQDQCPRDDLFSVLHVFVDLVVGDLPWRDAARSKDKAYVSELKQKFLKDPRAFMADLAGTEASRGNKDGEECVHTISTACCNMVQYLSSLEFGDTPDYDQMLAFLLQPALEALSETDLIRAMSASRQEALEAAATGEGARQIGLAFDTFVGSMRYEVGSFSWRCPASAIEVFINEYRSGGWRDIIEDDHHNDIIGSNSNSGTKKNGTAIIMPPLLLSTVAANHIGANNGSQGLAGNSKINTINHHKLRLLGSNMRLLIDVARRKNDSEGATKATSTTGTAISSSSSSSGSLNAEKAVHLHTAAVRWKNCTKELIKLPIHVVMEDQEGADIVQQFYHMLVEHDHFYSCNLGDMDVKFPDFVDIQSVVAKFYDFYADVRSRQRANEINSKETVDGDDDDGDDERKVETAAEAVVEDAEKEQENYKQTGGGGGAGQGLEEGIGSVVCDAETKIGLGSKEHIPVVVDAAVAMVSNSNSSEDNKQEDDPVSKDTSEQQVHKRAKLQHDP
mmetsp:Transcript_14525/g.24085  ORF Transcript_14525/g.24085 Transcript_14525/m.24085 type:complete len:849 (-) Transcript_14525:93-2639(-)